MVSDPECFDEVMILWPKKWKSVCLKLLYHLRKPLPVKSTKCVMGSYESKSDSQAEIHSLSGGEQKAHLIYLIRICSSTWRCGNQRQAGPRTSFSGMAVPAPGLRRGPLRAASRLRPRCPRAETPRAPPPPKNRPPSSSHWLRYLSPRQWTSWLGRGGGVSPEAGGQWGCTAAVPRRGFLRCGAEGTLVRAGARTRS